MPTHTYQLISRWRVEGTCGEVADILGDPLALADWWPSVYLKVVELEPPDANGLNRRIRLVTKGWLPYTLRWEFVVTGSDYPNRLELSAYGDFSGRGVWTFEQDGACVDIVYDWQVAAQKPLLRELSVLLKPLVDANHRWAMAQGETSLRLELARRRAASEQARATIAPPPGPVTYAAVALLGGVALAAAGLTYLVVRRSRRRRE